MKIQKWMKVGAGFSGITVVLLLLLEGAASVFLSINDSVLDNPVTHSHYHPTLGWTNRVGAVLPDFYGPGRDVRINAQGFRNPQEVEPEASRRPIRVMCSGDSFTFGQGVANDETWCYLLGVLDERIEGVNLGQPGYSVTQAALRYGQDATAYQHAIHIFAYIGADFERIIRPNQNGFGRPMLVAHDGQLDTLQVPVPRFRYWLSREVGALIGQFRTTDLVTRVVRRFITPTYPTRAEIIAAMAPSARLTLAHVEAMGSENGARTLFLYLPTESEIEEESETESWVGQASIELGLTARSLGPDLRGLPIDQARSYFIREGPSGAADHYTAAGNQWVAERILGVLVELGWLSDAPGKPGE